MCKAKIYQFSNERKVWLNVYFMNVNMVTTGTMYFKSYNFSVLVEITICKEWYKICLKQ